MNKRFRKIRYLHKISMPRPYGSLYDIDSGEYPSEEFDSEKVTEDAKGYSRKECEGNVCWYGNRDRMIKVDVDYIYAMDQNMFYPDLIKRIEEKIRSSSASDPAEIECGYGRVSRVDIDDIEVSITDREMDRSHNVLTTGDEELDLYLKDKEAYLENWKSQYEKEEIEELLVEAIKNKDGDLGEFIFQIRDGNHRAMAAKNAGEKYIWIDLETNQYNDLKNDRYGIYENYDEIKNMLQKKDE